MEPSSFTFNFKKLKKAIALTAALIILHEAVLARLWLPLLDPYGDFEFITWHHKEKAVNQAGMKNDVVFLGDSKALGGIDAKLFQDETGLPSYNLAMQAMPIEGQYFILRRYLKKNAKPKTVVVQPVFFLLNDLLEEEFADKFSRYFISPGEMAQLLPDLIKMKSRARKSLMEFVNRLFFITYSRRWVIQDFVTTFWAGGLKERHEKNSGGFDQMISRNGFFYFGPDKSLPEGFFAQKYQENPQSLRMFRFEPLKMHDKYLRKLIRFCREENIEMVFAFGPYPEEQYKILEQKGVVQALVDYARGLKKDYPELKLVEPIIWPEKNSNFFDFSHVNRKGAENWTRRMALLQRSAYSG